jgi:DNA polymerase III alpha subunit
LSPGSWSQAPGGAEVTVAEAGHLTLLVASATSWANLCRMLSAAGLAEGSTATPDINVDFAGDRREEVIQYVYRRCNTGRAATAMCSGCAA